MPDLDLDNVAPGASRDLCTTWPDDGHAMASTKPADTRISVRMCTGCGWIDGEDLEQQVTQRIAGSAAAQDRDNGPEPAPWLNRGTGAVSQRVYALIFNGLSGALTDFMRLSERARIAAAIYDSLADGGIEVRLTDGLARLRAVALEVADQDGATDGC